MFPTDWQTAARRFNRDAAIKLYRLEHGVDLAEGKRAVEAWCSANVPLPPVAARAFVICDRLKDLIGESSPLAIPGFCYSIGYNVQRETDGAIIIGEHWVGFPVAEYAPALHICVHCQSTQRAVHDELRAMVGDGKIVRGWAVSADEPIVVNYFERERGWIFHRGAEFDLAPFRPRSKILVSQLFEGIDFESA